MYWTNTWFSVLFNVFSEIRLPSRIWQHRKKKNIFGVVISIRFESFPIQKIGSNFVDIVFASGKWLLAITSLWLLKFINKSKNRVFSLRPETHKLPINAGVQNYLWGLQMVVYGSFRALAYIQAIYMLLRLSRLFYEYLLSFCATKTVGRALSSCVTLCFVLNG